MGILLKQIYPIARKEHKCYFCGGIINKGQKHDAKTFFIDELVHAYFVNKKLKELSEYDFINHWENIFR